MRVLTPQLGPIYDMEDYQINGNYEIVNKNTGEVVIEDEEWRDLPEQIKAEWLGLLRIHVDEVKESCNKHIKMWQERKKDVEAQYDEIKDGYKDFLEGTIRSENFTVYKKANEKVIPIEMMLDEEDYIYELTLNHLTSNDIIEIKRDIGSKYPNCFIKQSRKPKSAEDLDKEKYNKEITETVIVRKI